MDIHIRTRTEVLVEGQDGLCSISETFRHRWSLSIEHSESLHEQSPPDMRKLRVS